METKRKKMVLLNRWSDIIVNELTDEEAGRIIKAMNDYVLKGIEPDFTDRLLKWFWSDIKETLDYVNRN